MQPASIASRTGRSERHRAPLWPWLSVALAASVVAAALCRGRESLPPAGPATADAPASTSGAPDAVPVDSGFTARVDVAPAEPEVAAPLTFDDYIERLVALGLETMSLAKAGRGDEALASDRTARELFAQLMLRVADADARALSALCAHSGEPPPDDSEPPTPAAATELRLRVLRLVLEVGLRRRHEAGHGADLEQLVAGILAALPGDDDRAADLGNGLLADRPYLDLPHEGAVLELVAMSGAGEFPAPVASALLSTLWRNLRDTGRRSSQQLAGLALLLLDDGNASERVAAGRLLLHDERYRLVVLEHLRATRDPQLARELAMAAAQDLPPTQAFAVLAVAAQVTDQQSGPFLMLGHRDAALLGQEYERRLASDVEPRLRALLVAGAGFAGTPEGIELARLAFASDPDPEVKLRALFVLTGRAAASLGEQTLAAALDDPRIRDDPRRLGAAVLALENLARAGQLDAVDRLGQRLRTLAALDESARTTLEQILAHHLPRGRTSR